ncbi:MAG: hypothetical protein FWD47_13440 [Treponema sp.]|nr:hypothetical protein [Treponema sp.]
MSKKLELKMIVEYYRVIGEKDRLNIVGNAMSTTDDCICIEEDETNEVYTFELSEVKPESIQ